MRHVRGECLNKTNTKNRAGVAELDGYLEVTQTGEQTEYRVAPQLKYNCFHTIRTKLHCT